MSRPTPAPRARCAALLLLLAGLPGSCPAHAEEAERALRAGDAETALRLFAARLERQPGDAWAAAGEVDALVALGRFEEALDRARLHGAAFEGSAAVRGAHGGALLRAGRLEEAEDTLGPLESDPRAPPRALTALARLRAAAGRRADAARLGERALQDGGDEDPWVLFWAAECVADRARARKLLERYVELAPRGQQDWVEAARGTLRLQRALGEREVWVPAKTPDEVVLPLRLVWDDAGRKLGYVVEARIGPKDKPVKLMLDTGSTGLFLVERIARKRGFEFLAEETAFGGGGDKRHRNRRGLFPAFRLGELRFTAALAGTTRRELEPYGRYHGLLGIQALAGYRAVLDFAAQRLTLTRIDDVAADPGGEPFWMVSGQMLVRAEAAAGSAGMFLFDTGATWSVLSDRYLASLPEARSEPTGGVRGFGGKVEGASVVRGAALRFAGLDSGEGALRSFDMSLRSAVGGVEVAGFLGLDLLDGARITIDTVHQRVQVAAASRPRSP